MLIAWIVIVIGVNFLAGVVKADYRADNSLPSSESQQVTDLLEAASPNRAGFDGQIVFRARQGVDDATVRAEMEALFDDVDALNGVEDRKSVV